MSTQAHSDVELEELFGAEIPCGGNSPANLPCGRVATLRTRGHGCPLPPAAFKCTDCWMVWYRRISEKIARFGHVDCRHCRQRFYDIDAFSRYEAI